MSCQSRPMKIDGSKIEDRWPMADGLMDRGSSQVERPRILIVSDEAQFSSALEDRWRGEPRPAFSFVTPDELDHLAAEDFELAVVALSEPGRAPGLRRLGQSAVPIVEITAGEERKIPGAMRIPPVEDWPELTETLAGLVIDRERSRRQTEALVAANRELEDQATLWRHMLDMRVNLNNALTSILGNAELMLASTESAAARLHEQLTTIRNMGMRIHEILQRFSSLENEMRLMGQENSVKAAKATAGA